MLELGCGTGAVGLSLVKRNADVTLTDRGFILELARANAERNHTPGGGSVKVEELSWCVHLLWSEGAWSCVYASYWVRTCVHAGMRACVRVSGVMHTCVRACVRACGVMHACVHACNVSPLICAGRRL